jgi:hypothetical protein
MRRKHTEHDEQSALLKWAKLSEGKYPELRLLYAIPNAGKRPQKQNSKTGKWYSPGGNRLKEEGMKAGVPDLHLPVARRSCHGLWIEMKSANGKVSDAQKWWILALREQGHRVEVCYSWNDARKVIEAYLVGRREE